MKKLTEDAVLAALASGSLDKETLKLYMHFEDERRSREKQLHSKLAQIRAGMGSLPKDGENKHFKYSYISADSVMRAVQALLLRHRVELSISQIEARKEGKNTRVQMEMTFIDLDTGHQASFPWWGESNDAQDKGSSKAQTLGQKYFLLRYFLVPPNEDPDGGPSPQHQTIPDTGMPGRVSGDPPAPQKEKVWLPSKSAFFTKLRDDFELTPIESASLLKAASFTDGYNPALASEMYDAIKVAVGNGDEVEPPEATPTQTPLTTSQEAREEEVFGGADYYEEVG